MRYSKLIGAAMIAAFMAVATMTANAADYSAKVISVTNGSDFVCDFIVVDKVIPYTIIIKDMKVRLANIEVKDGDKARDWLTEKMVGKYFIIRIDDHNPRDKDRQFLGMVVMRDGKTVNKEMVEKGLAKVME